MFASIKWCKVKKMKTDYFSVHSSNIEQVDGMLFRKSSES